VTVKELREADNAGKWIQLMGRAYTETNGRIWAEVKPVATNNPFFVKMRGTSMGLYFKTSAAKGFGIWLDLGSGDRAIIATAAGVFEDILSIAKSRA
jgi:homoserine dehydrogenase